MIESMLVIVGAFFLYLLVLPLFGILCSFLVRVLLPYAVGAGALFALLQWAPLNQPSSLLLAFALAIFCAPALFIRFWPRANGLQLGWQQGHYRACFSMLSFGFCSRHEPVEEGEYKLEAVLRTE